MNLLAHQPDVVVLNAGYARVLGFEGSIIMGKEDVDRAYRFAPQATVIASHLEAVNHGMLTRKELRTFIAEKGLDHLSVPCILFGDILPGEQLFSLTVCAAEDGPIPAAHGMSVASTRPSPMRCR